MTPLFSLVAQAAPSTIPAAPAMPSAAAPTGQTAAGDPTLGLTLGTVVLLWVGIICVYHACHTESRIDRSSFLWGGAVFTILTTALLAVAGVGSYIQGVLSALTGANTTIPQPDWMGSEWNPRLIWLTALPGIWLVSTRLLKLKPGRRLRPSVQGAQPRQARGPGGAEAHQRVI